MILNRSSKVKPLAAGVEDSVKFALVKRWIVVKELLPHLIVENGKVYVIVNMADPWGSKQIIAWSELEIMILQAEAKLAAKIPPARETKYVEGSLIAKDPGAKAM
jgi:hypothetical protein